MIKKIIIIYGGARTGKTLFNERLLKILPLIGHPMQNLRIIDDCHMLDTNTINNLLDNHNEYYIMFTNRLPLFSENIADKIHIIEFTEHK
ncbi:MAG: hypothetical protein RBR02_06450 [Desulfuromonadaceae bacterium]|nr:hypothetical protein [Desulfuromonadaceae bacterium]